MLWLLRELLIDRQLRKSRLWAKRRVPARVRYCNLSLLQI